MRKLDLKTGAIGLAMTLILFAFFLTGCNENDYLLNGSTDDERVFSFEIAEEPYVPEHLEAPKGNYLVYHIYAKGEQIYRCNGTGWVFAGPEAKLYTDAGHKFLTGTHYAGPVWESNSGSIVKGAVQQSIPSPDPSAIPWLLLRSVTSSGRGIFKDVTFIQRVNTTGGKAPEAVCDSASIGTEIRVPYTAEYYFYKAR